MLLALRGRVYLSEVMSEFEPKTCPLVYFHTGMYQDWNLIQQDTAAQAKIEEEQRAEREAKERLDAVWQSTGASGALTRPSWLGRAARNRHRRAMEQASRRNAP